MWLIASKTGPGIQVAEPESPSLSLLVFRRKTDFYFSPKKFCSLRATPLHRVRRDSVIWGNKGTYDNDTEHGCEARVPAFGARISSEQAGRQGKLFALSIPWWSIHLKGFKTTQLSKCTSASAAHCTDICLTACSTIIHHHMAEFPMLLLVMLR